MDERTRIGANVRSARLRRGLSLDVVAGLAGRSKSWLSKVERGLLPLERRSDLAALADALQVSVVDLTGQPYLPGPVSTASVRALRQAMLDVPPRAAARPAEALAADVDRLTQQRQAWRLEDAARTATGTLTGIRAAQAVGDGEHRDVLRLLVWCCYETANLVRDLGYPDLGIVAARMLLDTAEELDDPAALGVAAFARTHSLAAVPASAFSAAVQVGTAAADRLAVADGAEALAAVGSLHLATGFALAAARRGEEAKDRLAEAERVAARVSAPTDVARHLAFGPANVAMHRLSVAVELGEPDAGTAAAAAVRPEDIPYPARRASYWSDLGRAYAQQRRDAEAVAALRRAEQIAPQRVRLHPLVREAVADMVDRAHRAAVGRELRGLAYRMGVPH